MPKKLFVYNYATIGQSGGSGVFMMALSTSSVFLLGVYNGNYYSFIHLLKVISYFIVVQCSALATIQKRGNLSVISN